MIINTLSLQQLFIIVLRKKKNGNLGSLFIVIFIVKKLLQAEYFERS